jgi:hypothetical protein
MPLRGLNFFGGTPCLHILEVESLGFFILDRERTERHLQ